MSKIYFDENGLTRLVNSNLENSINNLRQLIEISSALSIPYNFKYESYLKLLDNNFEESLNSVNSVYKTIKSSSRTFSNISNELNSDISGIENYSISLRQSAIK